MEPSGAVGAVREASKAVGAVKGLLGDTEGSWGPRGSDCPGKLFTARDCRCDSINVFFVPKINYYIF